MTANWLINNDIVVPKSDTTWITWAISITNHMYLTQSQYDAITTPDPNTLYYITT